VPGVAVLPSQALLLSGQSEEAAELQWRISPAILIVILGLMAIPLSHSAPREGRSARILLGFLAYIVYVNLLQISRSGIASGSLPAALGLWWVHVLGAAVTLIWLQRQGRMAGPGT
jgi:lipopolysaccharide export system permease protein